MALTDKLSPEAARCIRYNFSGSDTSPKPFETFDTRPLKGRYDVLIDLFGVAASDASGANHRA